MMFICIVWCQCLEHTRCLVETVDLLNLEPPVPREFAPLPLRAEHCCYLIHNKLFQSFIAC